MTVYVESNFVLELSLLQEDSEACDELLELCRDRGFARGELRDS